MFKLKVLSILLFTSSLAMARGASNIGVGNTGGRNTGGHNNGGGTTLPLCTGQEPARRGAEYTRNPSFDDKLAAFQVATAEYELAHPEAEAADYARVSSQIIGQSCLTDGDCATGDDSKYIGSCLRYDWVGTNGSCNVSPVVPVPLPPSAPKLACEDVTCPSHFQCEVENKTGAVGCVEQRLCAQQ